MIKDDVTGRECNTNVERRNTCEFWWESQKGRDYYEDQNVGEWIILKRILER
jgi:hypothetical protein